MTTLRTIPDAYVNQASPSLNRSSTATLAMRTGGTGNVYTLMQPTGLPPVGSTVVSAILKVYNAAAWAGAVTLTARQNTASWRTSTVTYNTLPASTATGAATRTFTGAAANTEWQLDITTIMQAWCSGAANYGLRLDATGTTALYIYAALASGTLGAYKPVIEVVWSTLPNVPAALHPDAGLQVSLASPTLTWAYSDPAGGSALAYQVQMNTANLFTTPAYDSGIITSALAQHTLTVAVPLATPEWWRVRVQNAAGMWSAYSTPATFGRTAKSAVTLTTPSAATPSVPTRTNPVAWTFGGTETKWRVYRPQPANSAVILADSGDQSGTALSYTSPTPFGFAGAGGTELVTVRVWDNVARAATPGDPPYVEASQQFTYVPGVVSGGVVTSLAFVLDPVQPFGKLTWQRATAPDAFTIVRDGVVIAADVPASNLLVSGTSYAYTDPTASPWNTHTWVVEAVVLGTAASGSPSVNGIIKPIYVWILDPADSTFWIALAGTDSGSWPMGEQSAMHEIRGADRQVLVSEAMRGYEGTMSGQFYSTLTISGLTAQQLRNRVWTLKSNPTKTWRLVVSDMNIPVILRNVVVTPIRAAELIYDLSFEFYQQGELPF